MEFTRTDLLPLSLLYRWLFVTLSFHALDRYYTVWFISSFTHHFIEPLRPTIIQLQIGDDFNRHKNNPKKKFSAYLLSIPDPNFAIVHNQQGLGFTKRELKWKPLGRNIYRYINTIWTINYVGVEELNTRRRTYSNLGQALVLFRLSTINILKEKKWFWNLSEGLFFLYPWYHNLYGPLHWHLFF